MNNKTCTGIILFFILVLAVLFRFWNIADVPPGLYHDEAINGNNALEVLETGRFKIFYPENNGREGLYINMLTASLAIFGKEAWAIRIVSALFGTLTVLGVYLLTRELFWNTDVQIQNVKIKMQNDNVKSKNVTFLTVIFHFALYMLHSIRQVIMLPKNELLALLSSFFLATSFWHINFSRIGFRGILVPFFLVWSFYFLYRAIRTIREELETSIKPELFSVLGGILFGLGFHTYIAYRLAPLLLIPPFLLALFEYKKGITNKCSPCMLILFLFFAFIAALPIGYYFLQNPADFAGRSAQVSAFTVENPLIIIGKNTVQTIGMFFWTGDYNWRHNIAGAPMLWWPISILFLIGIIVSIRTQIQNVKIKMQNDNVKSKNVTFLTVIFHFNFYILHSFLATTHGFLLLWLVVMSLPAIISSEGIPHALRTIGMIPPVIILSACGLVWLLEVVGSWLQKQKSAWPQKHNQLHRIRTELGILTIIFLIILPIFVWRDYFIVWATHTETRAAFNEEFTEIGRSLTNFPQDIPKYVMVNADGVLVRGIPMPAQSIMFFADGTIASRGIPTTNNIIYILPEDEDMLEKISGPYVSVSLK
jgi:4-amino-4-deoxy-L-arabinose transferase-like glycosyltransferase